MENSHIEWTNHTFNPWWGCMKVSDGCKNCYAETLDNRYNHNNPHWGPNSPRKPMSEAYWKQPFKWNEEARKAGIKAKVFCASMADVFEDHPDVSMWRDMLFAMISDTPNLIWQLLTKRPENINKFVPVHWLTQEWPENAWIGTSVENQQVADERINHLLKVPAKIRFLSCEPLLGPVNFELSRDPLTCSGMVGVNALSGEYNTPMGKAKHSWPSTETINWVICGGESGHNARPMHPDWARSLCDQCKEANVPFFFKQWGEYIAISQMSEVQINEIDTDYLHDKNRVNHELDPYQSICKMGKNWTGALLDGMIHKEFPN